MDSKTNRKRNVVYLRFDDYWRTFFNRNNGSCDVTFICEDGKALAHKFMLFVAVPELLSLGEQCQQEFMVIIPHVKQKSMEKCLDKFYIHRNSSDLRLILNAIILNKDDKNVDKYLIKSSDHFNRSGEKTESGSQEVISYTWNTNMQEDASKECNGNPEEFLALKAGTKSSSKSDKEFNYKLNSDNCNSRGRDIDQEKLEISSEEDISHMINTKMWEGTSKECEDNPVEFLELEECATTKSYSKDEREFNFKLDSDNFKSRSGYFNREKIKIGSEEDISYTWNTNMQEDTQQECVNNPEEFVASKDYAETKSSALSDSELNFVYRELNTRKNFETEPTQVILQSEINTAIQDLNIGMILENEQTVRDFMKKYIEDKSDYLVILRNDKSRFRYICHKGQNIISKSQGLRKRKITYYTGCEVFVQFNKIRDGTLKLRSFNLDHNHEVEAKVPAQVKKPKFDWSSTADDIVRDGVCEDKSNFEIMETMKENGIDIELPLTIDSISRRVKLFKKVLGISKDWISRPSRRELEFEIGNVRNLY